MKFALIGYGAIGQTVAASFPNATIGVLTRSPKNLPEHARALSDLQAIFDFAPDFVVEAAGQEAATSLVPELLAQGISVFLASVGALADPETEARMRDAPRRGAQLHIPAGAIGGIDMVAALDRNTIQNATYTGTKPPISWANSPAAKDRDLSKLRAPEVLFSGTAREAALRFPKNANVAATLALAGAGFDKTQVELVADPDARGNSHAFSVNSDAAQVRFEVTAMPDPENPGTSTTTAMSLARAIRNRSARFAI